MNLVSCGSSYQRLLLFCIICSVCMNVTAHSFQFLSIFMTRRNDVSMRFSFFRSPPHRCDTLADRKRKTDSLSWDKSSCCANATVDNYLYLVCLLSPTSFLVMSWLITSLSSASYPVSIEMWGSGLSSQQVWILSSSSHKPEDRRLKAKKGSLSK